MEKKIGIVIEITFRRTTVRFNLEILRPLVLSNFLFDSAYQQVLHHY